MTALITVADRSRVIETFSFHTFKCRAKVVAANAVPKLSLQMQSQSCRCKCRAKVVAANAEPKLSLEMQCQSWRCKCRAKVVAANAKPKLSLQMQSQSCHCKCSAKVAVENAMYFTKLGGKYSTVLATIFYVLQEMNVACNIGNDKITLSGQISLYLQ